MARSKNGLETRQDTSTSMVLSNGLQLLSLVAKTNGQLSLRDIGRRLELSPTVTHRLVATLRKHKYLERSPVTGKYVVGVESFIVGRSYTESTGVDAVAKPILEEAAKQYGVNCFMGVRKGTGIVYLYDFSGAKRTSIRIAPGTEVPLHVTSMGMAILAQLPADELKRFIDSVTAERTDDLSILGEQFDKQLRFARANGYSQLRSEVFPGVLSVGAVIPRQQSESEMAISFGIQANLVRDDDLAVLGNRILTTVRRIEIGLQRMV